MTFATVNITSSLLTHMLAVRAKVLWLLQRLPTRIPLEETLPRRLSLVRADRFHNKFVLGIPRKTMKCRDAWSLRWYDLAQVRDLGVISCTMTSKNILPYSLVARGVATIGR